jgi:flavin-dependent dehydrogenase
LLTTKSFETSWCITNNSEFDNLYLIGDALMTFDPTSSKGILKSMMTAIYAAFILHNIQQGKLTKSQGSAVYRQWADDFFEKELAGIKQLLPIAMVEKVYV